MKEMRQLLERVEKAFTEEADRAAEVAGKDMPLDIARSEAAAFVVLARVVLNLDETIVRD
jgi:hypothetical protein